MIGRGQGLQWPAVACSGLPQEQARVRPVVLLGTGVKVGAKQRIYCPPPP